MSDKLQAILNAAAGNSSIEDGLKLRCICWRETNVDRTVLINPDTKHEPCECVYVRVC